MTKYCVETRDYLGGGKYYLTKDARGLIWKKCKKSLANKYATAANAFKAARGMCCTAGLTEVFPVKTRK